jgi:hypothetical protein
MSSLGDEYVTEFGEFLEFDTDTKDSSEFHEDFVEWISLSDVDPTSSPAFERIRQAVAQSRELSVTKR